MAATNSGTVQVRITEQQRETLRLLKSSGQSYSDALAQVLDSEPAEYRAVRELAEQRSGD